MGWCDFCSRSHDTYKDGADGYDLDANAPTSLEEIRDGLAHAVQHGNPTNIAHRCADQHLVYALILLSGNTMLSDGTRRLVLEIIGHYQAFPKQA